MTAREQFLGSQISEDRKEAEKLLSPERLHIFQMWPEG